MGGGSQEVSDECAGLRERLEVGGVRILVKSGQDDPTQLRWIGVVVNLSHDVGGHLLRDLPNPLAEVRAPASLEAS
ncbi:hypothetical protein G7085_20370 [Tessaracoccus sp. HDW20]|nr:hypothetical protein [Tessaracoccus coleopterorum]NHB86083.1 hypothetical protein [Tessaracoccus coleopterorum]